jgi:hypothetical protein
MPSPYGNYRGAAQYYQYGGAPQHMVYNWYGMPAPAAMRSASQAELADFEPAGPMHAYEVIQAAGDDYIDVVARAQFHKTLGDTEDQGDTDAASMVEAYKKADAGKYPTWPVAMTMESARRSVRHSGPEQTQLDDEVSSLGFFGAMSDNEKRALVMVAIAGAGYLFWRAQQKKARRANPPRRRRRRRR